MLLCHETLFPGLCSFAGVGLSKFPWRQATFLRKCATRNEIRIQRLAVGRYNKLCQAFGLANTGPRGFILAAYGAVSHMNCLMDDGLLPEISMLGVPERKAQMHD